jgi:hypothetical protein
LAGRYVRSRTRAEVRKELEGYGVTGAELYFADTVTKEVLESVMADDGSSTSEE